MAMPSSESGESDTTFCTDSRRQNRYEAQQSSTCAVPCSICGVPVRLDQCKIDENGLAVHARCYVEKVSERNGTKI